MKRGKPMKTILVPLFTMLLLMISGCTGTTPIENLSLPPVTVIEGTVTQIDESGFRLRDNTGSIYVKAELPDRKKLNLSLAEQIKVYGNLEGGLKKVYDGYVIEKESGERIIINNPTPHFGFILQTSFKE
jgi:hypothetical protein